MCLFLRQLGYRVTDGSDALENLATQHAVGKLGVERFLECEHDFHARMGGHAGLVEVVIVGQIGDCGAEPAVLHEDLAHAY